jgi:hypothetical protein
MLPIAVAAPFAVYLLVHSLHDRVQGHWPAPIFGSLAICAAAAFDDVAGQPWGRWLGRLIPGLGLVIGAVATLMLAFPSLVPQGRFDPVSPLRGWPQFAGDIEAMRAQQGAAWVGTQSYGVLAQLTLTHRITTPLLQVIERDRYEKDSAARPDADRPGLVVDLERRLVARDLSRCFAEVSLVGPLNRAGGVVRNERYAAYLVARPKRDIWIIGCPAQISPGVWR